MQNKRINKNHDFSLFILCFYRRETPLKKLEVPL